MSIDPSTRPGEQAFLADYDPHAWPPFAATVDLNILTIREGALCALLIERAEHPYRGYLALPGGHIEQGKENADTAAARELNEETGLDWPLINGPLEQVKSYTDPDRDPRSTVGLHVTSVAYYALAPNLPTPVAASDASAADYIPIDTLDLDAQRDAWLTRTPYEGEAASLGFDHALILSDALERIRAKLEYTTLALDFVPELFSLADLRRVYAAVWGVAPDLANFRRKILSTEGFVVPVRKADEAATEIGGARPTLYRRGDAKLVIPPMMRPTPNIVVV